MGDAIGGLSCRQPWPFAGNALVVLGGLDRPRTTPFPLHGLAGKADKGDLQQRNGTNSCSLNVMLYGMG